MRASLSTFRHRNRTSQSALIDKILGLKLLLRKAAGGGCQTFRSLVEIYYGGVVGWERGRERGGEGGKRDSSYILIIHFMQSYFTWKKSVHTDTDDSATSALPSKKKKRERERNFRLGINIHLSLSLSLFLYTSSLLLLISFFLVEKAFKCMEGRGKKKDDCQRTTQKKVSFFSERKKKKTNLAVSCSWWKTSIGFLQKKSPLSFFKKSLSVFFYVFSFYVFLSTCTMFVEEEHALFETF